VGLVVVDQSSDTITPLPDLDFPARHLTVQPRGNLVAAFGNGQSLVFSILGAPTKRRHFSTWVRSAQPDSVRTARFSPSPRKTVRRDCGT
jgi:hypothetical protein